MEHGARPHRANGRTGSRLGRLHVKRPMRPLRVVVPDEFGEDRGEVLFVEHDDVVQALSAERPDHPFGYRVRLWRSDRRGDSVDADALGSRPEVAAVDGIAIPQEMAGLAFPGRRFDQLAPHQAAVGFAVTFTCTSSRRPWAMKTRT